ncbi:hypothetical protein PA598K_04193 [Paenibacillus sp. 598K]|uniref:DUF2634 domain-containing protein n=1 Tax=Paenibacillus sp. 598K TaxID=1117987 RepID=UPI000FF937EF|nr:DUF2634 domain-containing protein [Paenibacillus sp. 598K]GBF75762.1 hypothetical protein PA598K_04193 [Paenibacillus sp. 598K]
MILPSGSSQLLAVSQSEQPSLTYKLCLSDGRVIGQVDGVEAVKQFVNKQLRTERFAHEIYTGRIGNSIYTSDIESAVEEALLIDERIVAIENMTSRQIKDEVELKFTVVTNIGRFEEEVTFNV